MPDMRDQLKCSRCRAKKIKCLGPPNRPAHQKCDNCSKHGACCGPNYRKKDDPGYSELGNEAIANHEDSIRDLEDQPRAPTPLLSRTVHNAGSVGGCNAYESSNELREEVISLLKSLNSMGRAYDFGSDLTPICCRNRDNPYKYNKQDEDKMKATSDEFHSLFMGVCQRGFCLQEQGLHTDADRIFMKLLMALRSYHGSKDDRKNGALRRIARFYLDIGDEDEYERVLMMVTETDDIPIHQEDPYLQLADSFIESSKRAYQDLDKHWKKQYMAAEETSLAIPPIQRSAQHRNACVTTSLLGRLHLIAHSPPALFNRGALHIAATRGHEQNLKNILQAKAQVDALDLHNHTALFLAAAKGHEGCCAELINWGANVNLRDRHGTTILEAAAGAGHFKVVQRLVDAGADVNPDLVCCGSSPLQAAIENPKSPLELVVYLLSKDGDVSIRRKDGKNAIDLAAERDGCGFLAELMRQKEVAPPRHFFEEPQPFFITF